MDTKKLIKSHENWIDFLKLVDSVKGDIEVSKKYIDNHSDTFPSLIPKIKKEITIKERALKRLEKMYNNVCHEV